MRRKYKTLVVASNAAGYRSLRALSRKVADRSNYRGAWPKFQDDVRKRGEAVVDLHDNHGFTLGELSRLLDLTVQVVSKIYQTAKHRTD